MIYPFNAEMFVDKTLTNTTSVGLDPYEMGILKNFESIVKEKYSDRVFSLLNREFVYQHCDFITGLRAAPKVPILITNFMDALVTTNKKIFLLNYAITPQGMRFLRHTEIYDVSPF